MPAQSRAVLAPLRLQGLEQALDGLIGSWKKPDAPAYKRWETSHKPVAAARVDVQATDKANASMNMSLRFSLNDHDADAPAMNLATAIFGTATDRIELRGITYAQRIPLVRQLLDHGRLLAQQGFPHLQI